MARDRSLLRLEKLRMQWSRAQRYAKAWR